MRSHFAGPAAPAEEQGEFVPMVRASRVAVDIRHETEMEPELDLEQP